jgi:hypothetical protein
MNITKAKWLDDGHTVKVNDKLSVPINEEKNRHAVILRAWVADGGVIKAQFTPAEIAKHQTNPPSVEITLLLDILVDKNVITLADKKRIAGEI